MPNLFYAGQTDYIEKLNTLATTESVTDGSLAASFLSLVVAGLSTFGGGMQVNAQGSAPATPASGFTIFADASDIPGWKGENGYVVKLDATANTADRTYTLPNASGTFALLSAAQTFTAAQVVSINSASAALTLTQAGAGAALSTNGQIVSTLGTGTAPFSVVSTTQVNNLNAQYLGGATFAAPGTIGSGTPGAATFTTLTVSGTSTLGITRVSSADANSPQFGVSGTSKGIRFVTAAGASGIQGVDNTLIGSFQPLVITGSTLTLTSSATDKVDIATNAGAQIQLRVNHTASAVNCASVTGSATGNAVRYGVDGSDTNVTWAASSKGAFGLAFYTNSFVNPQFVVGHTASAVNYAAITGAATGGAPSIYVGGSDANVSFAHYTKGTGSHLFFANGGLQLLIGAPASSVNYWQFFGSAAGGALGMYADGADTNIAVVQSTKGTGSHFFRTNGGAQTQFLVGHEPSAVNYSAVYGGSTGNRVTFLATGTDANVGLCLMSKGSGDIITKLGGFGGVVGTAVIHVASAVNWLTFTPSTTGNAVTISTGGSDTNRSLTLTAAGTGTVNVTNPLGLQRYTVATLPAATTDRLIIVSDESGGLVPAFSDGTNWRRVTDRAIVS